MPWDQLHEYWKETIVETAAILVVSEFEHRRAVYIPRSPIFGFPDIVTVEFVTLRPERSSVAVYSSRYGGYDFAKTASASNDGYSYSRRLHTHEREHKESTLVILILPRHCCSELEADEVRVVQYR